MKLQMKLFILLFLVVSCSNKENKTKKLTIFTASSTLEFLTDVSSEFEKISKIKIIINTASSGILARQIEAGAKADVFISASQKWIDYLIKNKIGGNKILHPMRNSLVLITSKKSIITNIQPINILSTLNGGRLAIGDPTHVPAGRYAKETLINLGIYDTIQQYILPAQNVRTAMRIVEVEECNLGIVYSTDAKKSKKISIVYSFDDSLHSPINYGVVVTDSTNIEAIKFYDFFNSKIVDSLMNIYGFIKNE